MGCSTSFAKLILFVFNVAFFVFGVVCLGVGIWSATNNSELFKLVNLIDSHVTNSSNTDEINTVANHNGLIQVAGAVLITVGVFTLVVGFCGCFGAMKESKCLLMIYACLIGVILIAELAVGIAAGAFKGRVHSEATKALLELENTSFVALSEYNSGKLTGAKASVTLLINYMQLYFECCGAQTPSDVSDSSSWKSSNRSLNGKEMLVPFTCCRVKDKESMLSPTFDWKSVTVDSLVDSECPFIDNSTAKHTRTCPNSVVAYIDEFSTPLIIICVGVALIELIGILLACCLIRSIDNDVNYAK